MDYFIGFALGYFFNKFLILLNDLSNYDYENDLNDRKRQIFLLNKRYVKDLVSQYKKLVM